MEFTKAIGFKGYYPDLPPDMCPEGALIAGSKNFRIVNSVLEARAGKELLQAGVVTGIPLLLHVHEDIAGIRRLMLCTSTDVYWWDDDNTVFKYLTPYHATGTADCSVDPTVEGAGGCDWVTADIQPGDQIGFGDNDPDAITTWYEIDSVTDLDTLELTENGPDTEGAGEYVIRKVFTALPSMRWEATDFYDGNAEENLLILTNGSDVAHQWDPDDTMCKVLGGDPPVAKHVGVLGGRLIFGNIISVTGTGVVASYAIIWSPVADAENWVGGATDDAGFKELYRTAGEIQFMADWSEFLIIAKADCVGALRVTGDPDNPLDYDYMVMSGGSIASVYHVMETGIIYLAKDDVLVFNSTPLPRSIAHGKVADSLFDDFNHQKRYLCTAVYSPRYNEWRLSIPSADAIYPDRTFVYRIKEDEWQYDDNGYIALGAYNYKTETLLNDLTLTLDSYDAPIDEWSATGSFSEVIFGDENGYIYIERPELKQDNDVDVALVAVTADNAITSLDQVERIQQSIVHYKGTGAVADELSAQLSVDGGATTQAGQTFNNNESAIRRRAKQSWNNAGRTARLVFTGRRAHLLAYRFGYEPEGDR